MSNDLYVKFVNEENSYYLFSKSNHYVFHDYVDKDEINNDFDIEQYILNFNIVQTFLEYFSKYLSIEFILICSEKLTKHVKFTYKIKINFHSKESEVMYNLKN